MERAAHLTIVVTLKPEQLVRHCVWKMTFKGEEKEVFDRRVSMTVVSIEAVFSYLNFNELEAIEITGELNLLNKTKKRWITKKKYSNI